MLTFVLKNNSFGNITLTHAPVGWDDIKYSFKRSKDYSGVTKSFVIDELGFIKEGRDYIKNILNKRDIMEEITIEVWKDNPNTFKKELYFTGKLDFKNYSEGDTKIFVNVEQSGFTMKFLNQDEVPIDILSERSLKGSSITRFDKELIEVPLHSKVIKKTFYSTVNSEYIISPEIRTDQDEIHLSPGLEVVTTSELERAYNYGLGFVFDKSSIFETIEAVEDGVYVFDFQFAYEILVQSANRIEIVSRLYIQKNDETPRLIDEHIGSRVIPFAEAEATYPEAVSRNGIKYNNSTDSVKSLSTVTYYLKRGDKVKLFFTVRKNDVWESVWFVFKDGIPGLPTTYLKIIGDTIAPETTCLGQLPFETFTRVCECITDKKDIFESTLLGRTDSQPVSYASDGDGSLYLCTGGKQIRRLPIAEHPLHFTFKELFKTFDAKHNIGVGVEKRDNKEVIVIEKKGYFYNDSMIADLGKVSDIKESIAIDHYYNTVKIGYEKYENEVVNGLDEIASEAQYSTPIVQVKNEYEKLAPYRSDGYGIETARRLSDEPTKDSEYDKDRFTICLLRDGENFVSEEDSEFDYIENVISPETIYNGRDTPSRMLRRHGNMITPSLLKTTGSLKYVKGEANNKMVSKLSIEPYQVKEDADIAIEKLEKPMFIPRFHEFEHPAKSDLLRAIEANPYGYLQYTDKDDKVYQSYIDNVDFDPNTDKAQFKLIRRYE